MWIQFVTLYPDLQSARNTQLWKGLVTLLNNEIIIQPNVPTWHIQLCYLKIAGKPYFETTSKHHSSDCSAMLKYLCIITIVQMYNHKKHSSGFMLPFLYNCNSCAQVTWLYSENTNNTHKPFPFPNRVTDPCAWCAVPSVCLSLGMSLGCCCPSVRHWRAALHHGTLQTAWRWSPALGQKDHSCCAGFCRQMVSS